MLTMKLTMTRYTQDCTKTTNVWIMMPSNLSNETAEKARSARSCRPTPASRSTVAGHREGKDKDSGAEQDKSSHAGHGDSDLQHQKEHREHHRGGGVEIHGVVREAQRQG